MMKLLLLSLLTLSTLAKKVELINEVIVDKNYINVRINKEFKKKFLHSDFFARYDNDVDLSKLDYSVQILPCIANLISIIWISGKTYYINSLDEEFYNSMKIVKKIFKRMYPNTAWDGELIPRTLVKNSFISQQKPDEKERTALLFSGGLDSITSSLYHRDKKQLLITVNSYPELPLHHKKHLKKRRKELEKWGKKLKIWGKNNGHENTFIDSNYSDFLNKEVLYHYSPEIPLWRVCTVEGIGWAGLAAPVMAAKGYQTLLHGSGITWDFNFPAAANPFIDNNIFFSGMRLKHDLFDMHRLGKCEYLANLCKTEAVDRPHIRVCVKRQQENCCECRKCICTIIQLVVAGEDPHDYGFQCNIGKIINKSKDFIERYATNATTMWHFMYIQKKIKKQLVEGEKIHPGLNWLLDYNLKGKITSDTRNQRTLDWRDFVDLLPDIEIPDDIELAF